MKSVDSLARPWISGIAKAAYAHTKPKKESRPLTVKEIIQLETFLIKGMGHHLHKYACGVFLCMLYGMARSSDFRNIDRVIIDFCEGEDRTGYIEKHTVDYKCARLSRVTGRPYIIFIPVYGLCGESWGRAFVTAAATNGVDISALSGPMLLCPDASGQLTSRYPSANEVTLWVNDILDRLIANGQPGFTSRGLKATMLSWASKAGVDEYDRQVLGGHSMKGRQTAATYARDTLTSPIKKLEEVISSVVTEVSYLTLHVQTCFHPLRTGTGFHRTPTMSWYPLALRLVAQQVSRRGQIWMGVLKPTSCPLVMLWKLSQTVRQVRHHLTMSQTMRLRRSFTGKNIVRCTNTFVPTSCIFSPWALRLGLSFVAERSRKITRSFPVPSHVIVGSASNVIVADLCMMLDRWLHTSTVLRPDVPLTVRRVKKKPRCL